MGAVRDFEQKEIARILEACTRCGKCFEACVMTDFGPFEGVSGSEIVGGVLALLRREPSTPAALAWTSVCTASGTCVPACPENVNPKMMMRLARITALGGLGGENLLHKRDDPNYFNKVRAFALLQLSEEERKTWT